MSPRLTKLALTAHVTASVGWLGAVAAFLALAVVALTSEDGQTSRAAHLMMEPTGRYILVPLSFASLLTGLVQSLGTKWRLVQHYWVLFKLLINAVATIVLLSYMQTLGYLTGVAADPTTSGAHLRTLALSPLIHAGAALVLLLVATTLSVYKPRGLTRYGQRKHDQRARSRKQHVPSQA